MTRLWKILIALDQLLGTLLFNGIGPDETISAYCWRRGYTRRIAFLDFFFGKNHCGEAYMSEKTGAHHDMDYTKDTEKEMDHGHSGN